MKNKYNHKKKYGQNFLDSDDILNKIKEAVNLNKDDTLEIGPGHGFLTKMLLESSNSLTCYEIDSDLIPYLKNKFKEYSNFNLINMDFMDANIEGKNLKVVANIPYYITSPIIEKLIQNREKINEIYIMVQKEVAIRLCTEFKSSNVSTLTHYVRFYTKPTYLFTVEKEYFDPVPKVDSAFIKLEIRKDRKYENMIDEEKYFSFISKAFSSKRKTLVNNLKNSGIEKEKLEEILENKKVRAEELTIEDFIRIMKELNYD